MYRMANIIAGMFPNGTERQPYQDAAYNFRIPYWDWTLEASEGEEFLPGVFWNATVEQNGPRGIQTIRNPLYAYEFHPKDENAFIWSPVCHAYLHPETLSANPCCSSKTGTKQNELQIQM